MANFNGKNLAKSLERPVAKIDPTEINTRVKYLREKFTIDQILNVADKILGPKIPEGAVVLDAYLVLSASTGAGGIFDMGHEGGFVIDTSLPGDEALMSPLAADSDAFVQQADAGGQAVLQRAAAASILGDNLGKIGEGGVQISATLTEATTTTDVTPVELEMVVVYALEF